MTPRKPTVWFLQGMSNLSPYNVSLVLLINHYCTETSPTRHKLAVLLWECIRYNNFSLNQLTELLNQLDDTQLGDKFLNFLENSFKNPTIEDLTKLLGSGGKLQQLMCNTTDLEEQVKPSSPFGLFLRHMIISYKISSFEQISTFICDINRYIENKDTICPMLSIKQQEAFFCREVAKFKNDLSMNNSNSEIYQKSVAMADENVIQQAEFLQYLNFLSIKEYNLAKKHLHQYFTMMFNSSDETKNIRPFSALYLAAMHTVFEHKELAMQYLKESIHLAQLLGEESCLSQCIAWMSYLQGTPISTPALSQDTEPSELELLEHGHTIEKMCKVGDDPDKILKYLCDISHLSTRTLHNTNSSQIFRWYGNSLLQDLYPFFSIIQICPEWTRDGHMITFSQNGRALCAALCNLALSLAASPAAVVKPVELLNVTKSLFPPFSSHQDLIMLTLNKIKYKTKKTCNKSTEVEEKLIRTISRCTHNGLTNTQVGEEEDRYMTSVEHTANVLYNSARADMSSAPSLAVETLLKLVLHSRKYRLLEYQLRAHLLLTEAQMHLQMYSQALNTIQNVFIQALAAQDSYIQYTARWLYCQAKLAVTDQDSRYSTFQTLQHHLKLALDGFVAMCCHDHVCHILYFLTRLYDEFGMKDDRNKCAKRFKLYHVNQSFQEIS